MYNVQGQNKKKVQNVQILDLLVSILVDFFV